MPFNFIPICDFADEFFVLPDGNRLKLLPHQRKVLSLAFDYDENGKLPYTTVCYSAPKKSGKTAIASLVVAWFTFIICELNDEVIICANDKDQATRRVFQALRDSVRMEPALNSKVISWKQFSLTTDRGVKVDAIANDYAGAAGANFSLVTADEPWALMSEASQRLYEELTPVPTRRNSVRFLSTYAGMTGESVILEDVYKTGLKGKCIDDELNIWVNESASLFMYWDHFPRMPWHTQDYLDKQRKSPGMRPKTYQRLWQNQWTTSDDIFDIDEWDRCVEAARFVEHTRQKAFTPNKKLFLGVGVDASIKRDRAAVTTVFKLGMKLLLGPRAYWQPSQEDPIDFEETMEEFILWLAQNYTLGPVYYDPYQFHRSAMTLYKKGIQMVEWNQTIPNGCLMGNNLLDLISNTNLLIYDDPPLRKEATQVSLKEIPGRGYRIDKSNPAKKIDSIVSLAMACLATDKLPASDESFRDSLMILRK